MAQERTLQTVQDGDRYRSIVVNERRCSFAGMESIDIDEENVKYTNIVFGDR